MFEEIRKILIKESEESIRNLSSTLSPDIDGSKIFGVRIPKLRKIAKQIAKEDWNLYLKESQKEEQYFEEKLLEGLVIAYAKMDFDERLELIKGFVPKIDSWGVNDSFCPTIKVKDQDLEKVWNFILPYLRSESQFEVRFAVIMMLDNFIIDEYVDKVIKELDMVKNDGYYAEMAIAWTLAEAGIKYNEKTMKYLKGKNNLDKFTYNKTLQKMRESYRIPDEQKEELKKIKK